MRDRRGRHRAATGYHLMTFSFHRSVTRSRGRSSPPAGLVYVEDAKRKRNLKPPRKTDNGANRLVDGQPDWKRIGLVPLTPVSESPLRKRVTRRRRLVSTLTLRRRLRAFQFDCQSW